MAVRKTAVNKKKKILESPPVVTQVVEEVNEGVDLPSQTLEEIKVDAQNIENAVEKLEKETVSDDKEAAEEAQESATIPEEEDVSAQAEKKREVVEELFEGEKSGLMPQISMYENNSSKKLIIWVLVVVGVALLTGGGLIVAVKGKFPKMPALFAKPTPPAKQDIAPQGTPIPTPTPIQPDRADLTVEVLNGGGTPGAGLKMKEVLEEKGYTVSAVGNAEKYTYKETELHVKASKTSFLMLLTEDLKDSYTIGTSSSSTAEDASYDAQVIVGKE